LLVRFPKAARRTRRATLTAPGSPQFLPLGCGPTVKFGLHLRYPPAWPHRDPFKRSATIRWRILRHCSLHPFSELLPPFPMCRALPGSEYYGGSAPPQSRSADGGPSPTPTPAAQVEGRPGTVPVFTVIRSTEEEPDFVPAASPRLPRRTSPWPPGRQSETCRGVPHSDYRGRVRTAPGPDPPGSSRFVIEGRMTPVPRVLLSVT